MTPREANVLRAVLAVLSTAFAAFGALAVGGLTYTVGTALWSDAGFVLRLSGWALMVLALAVPSQLTLGLPLACTLAVGLQRVDRAQPGGRVGLRAPTAAGRPQARRTTG